MYTPSKKQLDAIANNFRYHLPRPNQPDRYTAIRDAAGKFAMLLVTNCPDSRELSVALTELETSVMWANASIARNEKES